MTKNADVHGAPTTSDGDALQGINDFVEGFVGYQPRATHVLAAADAHPNSALANIYSGMLWMFLERVDAPGKASPYLDAARQCKVLNTRERGLLQLLSAWQSYDFDSVIKIAADVLADHPQDLATLKVLQYHLFNRGDSPGMLRCAQQTRNANEGRAPWYSMLAFGHEQCHHIDLAERAAMAAIDIDQHEPWAHHAMAHVHLTRGEAANGKAFLTACSPSWQHLNSFMFTHNWWHLALFEIAEGDVSAALAIYDDRCWGVEPEYSQDQIGAVSLLARLECAGVDVGDRWQALLPFLESRDVDVLQPFLTLQYLYGLARAGSNRADYLMALVRDQAVDPLVSQDQALWQAVGIPAAEGVYAHAQARYAQAAKWLASVRTRLWQAGGSHAQRDVFDQLLLDAYLKSEQWVAAQQMLERRRQWEPDSPILASRLRAVHDHLHL